MPVFQRLQLHIIIVIQSLILFLFVSLYTVRCRLHRVLEESTFTFSQQKEGPQSHKQLSLQCDDQADSHQTQTWMKDKAPSTQLLYVPLLATEFIKWSMRRKMKAPVLGDFPLLA